MIACSNNHDILAVRGVTFSVLLINLQLQFLEYSRTTCYASELLSSIPMALAITIVLMLLMVRL